MKKTKKGQAAFEEYYAPYLEALKKTSLPILRFPEKNRETIRQLFKNNNLSYEELNWHKNSIHRPKEIPLGKEIPGNEKHLFYIMNSSSLLPPLCLKIEKNQKILDACAAPGGKSLLISEKIRKSGELILNEQSLKRLTRLKENFKNYAPNAKPKFLNQNAATIFKKYPEYFDRILLDAPCSSEKHVYKSPKHLKIWSKGRIKQITYLQKSLINGLFLALKPGGIMVYSTCSINEEENEKLIEKFLKKYKEKAKILPYPKKLPGANKNSPFGRINILKNSNKNLDPMFIAIIKKTNNKNVKN